MPAQNDTYARFYIHPSLISGSVKLKTAVHKDVVFIEIFIKGSTNTTFGRAKNDEDETQYAKEWTAYINNVDVSDSGTRLDALPTIGPSAVMNLNNKGINTVEDLAELDDAFVIGELGMLDLRKAANAYLDALHPEEAEAREQEVRAKENEQSETIARMQAQIDLLSNASIPEKKTRRKRNAQGILE